MSDRYTELLESAKSCVLNARAINERYSDPTKMKSEDAELRDRLLGEAQRLRRLADSQKAQDDLDSWMSSPAKDHPALEAMAKGETQPASEALQEVMATRESKAFFKWFRGGLGALDTEDRKALRYDGQKAALVEDATGEILVPHDIVGPIFKDLPHLGTFRSSGPTIRNTTSNKVDIRSLGGATAGWGKLEVGATPITDANVQPGTPTQVIEVHDLVAMAKVGVDELSDTDFNLAAMIQQIVGLQFAMMEDDAFANGNGVSKPWGLGMRATQASPVITQGTAVAAITASSLKALPYFLPTRYRTNGKYFASDAAAQSIALLQDGTSNYYWQPSIRAGEPDTLFGYPFYTLEGLPSTGTSKPTVVFGDPMLGYMIANRQSITVQRLDELYAADDLVGFKFKLRVGGDVIRPKAWAKYVLT